MDLPQQYELEFSVDWKMRLVLPGDRRKEEEKDTHTSPYEHRLRQSRMSHSLALLLLSKPSLIFCQDGGLHTS